MCGAQPRRRPQRLSTKNNNRNAPGRLLNAAPAAHLAAELDRPDRGNRGSGAGVWLVARRRKCRLAAVELVAAARYVDENRRGRLLAFDKRGDQGDYAESFPALPARLAVRDVDRGGRGHSPICAHPRNLKNSCNAFVLLSFL